MPIETRSNSALFRRAEQLKRWEDSETNKVKPESPVDKKSRIKFSEGCVFLAACAASDTEEVERLLEQAADINTANVDGLTALHQACIDDNLEMVQFLVEHECDVNRGDNEGWTPLHATASCGFISIAKYLLEHGANVAAVNNDGDLPIDIAESEDMEDLLSDVLDEKGIDCDEARSEEERIMLEDAKQWLNSNKFQDKIHPRTGATALHVAAAKSYVNVMKILMQTGADLNAQDNDGWTPLHAAAHWGQKEACAILADNLANMDIQNFAGQTCFDVAEPDLVKLLEELKKKQASMQKERPEIQAILQRTSTRPPLKRRTSVTRMSGQEKSKSVIKDTKSERAQIEQLCLPEEETEEEKEKKQNEPLPKLPSPKQENTEKEEVTFVKKKENVVGASATKEKAPTPKELLTEKIPSWKKVIRKASETRDEDLKSIPLEEPTVILKKPKKTEMEDREASNGPVNEEVKERPFIPPARDDESESQRKAHAKRVRETRRSTQGVLLEDLRSAEMQFLKKTQEEATKRQEEERRIERMEQEKQCEKEEKDSERSPSPPPMTIINKSATERSLWKSDSLKEKEAPQSPKVKLLLINTSEDANKGTVNKPIQESSCSPESPPSVTVPLRTKTPTQSNNNSTLDEQSQQDNRASLGTQAAIQRRRRPKRRSTGVVYLDSDDAQDEKVGDGKADDSSETEKEKKESISISERARLRFGSSGSIPDTSSEVSSRSEASRYSSRSSLNEDQDTDYKKLYEALKVENERLREDLKKTEEELEKTKAQLQKSTQSNNNKNSVSEIEKKERRALERKLSEMEEEIKTVSKLKAENEKLKAENRALSRVVCKLSK